MMRLTAIVMEGDAEAGAQALLSLGGPVQPPEPFWRRWFTRQKT